MALVDLLGGVQNREAAVKLPELRHATVQMLTPSLKARDGAIVVLLTGGWPYDALLAELGGLAHAPSAP